jgi:hypothetical protein
LLILREQNDPRVWRIARRELKFGRSLHTMVQILGVMPFMNIFSIQRLTDMVPADEGAGSDRQLRLR